MEWLVSPEESGLKLGDFIKLKMSSLSAKKIKSTLERGACSVNGRIERFSSNVLGKGDLVVYQPPEEKSVISINQMGVLFEDDFLFIYNKPAGVTSDDPKFLKEVDKLSAVPLILLHRLDKETSGILLFAKTVQVQTLMIEMFRELKVKKKYKALVDGYFKTKAGRIENYLGKVGGFHGQSLWGSTKEGKKAITEWQAIGEGEGATLVQCMPITGRTHQLRVHLSEMGHPILGDLLYGRKFACKYKPKRCMLHASFIEFEHPKLKKTLLVEAPIPNEMEIAKIELKISLL